MAMVQQLMLHMSQQFLLQFGTSAGLAVLLYWVFHYEYELPLVMNLILLPPVLVGGYLVALVLVYRFGARMVYALGAEFGLLLVLLILYDHRYGN
jgi:hypothetical protein